MAKRAAKQVQTVAYVVTTIPYKGSDPQPRFAFDASDDTDAKSKSLNWALRHGICRDDVGFRLAVGSELSWPRENSWVR